MDDIPETKKVDAPNLPQKNEDKTVSQPKTSRNLKLAFSILMGTLLVLVIGYVGYYLGSNKNKEVSNITSNSLSTLTPTNTEPSGSAPVKNALYLAKYNGKQGIFSTDSSGGDYYKGRILYADGADFVSYKDLQNPVKILDDGAEVQNFEIHGDLIYVALFESNDSDVYPMFDEIVYKITIGKEDKTEVWRNQVGVKRYTGSMGWGLIDEAQNGNFLIMSMISCYACEGGEVGKLVINMKTRKEKYLEDIGNIKIYEDNNSFTYQKNAPFIEKCPATGDPRCDEKGELTMYKPTGETFTEPLP